MKCESWTLGKNKLVGEKYLWKMDHLIIFDGFTGEGECFYSKHGANVHHQNQYQCSKAKETKYFR